MGTFGRELRRVSDFLEPDVVISTDPTALDVDISGAIDNVIREANRAQRDGRALRGLILEIPPGHYSLSLRPGEPRSVYDLPANTQLYMCPGALLRPDLHVDLVIRGSLHAGLHQIFGYDRYRDPAERLAALGDTRPRGRIIFAGKLVPALYPEWWGADTRLDSTPHSDSAPAIQASIDAACVTRDYPEPGSTVPHARPTLPVLLGGQYTCYRTLGVHANHRSVTSERHLILRGRVGLGGVGVGAASIRRVWNPANPEDAERNGCVLRLGPEVHFEIEDLGLTVNESGGEVDDVRVAGCLDIDDRQEGPPGRRGLLRRCSLTGGLDYTIRVRGERADALRRVHVVDCAVAPNTVNRISLHGIEVEASHQAMVHVEGALMAMPDCSVAYYPTVDSLPANAALYLRGGSVLLQAVQFHGGSGPRPSRGNRELALSIGLDRPDGQSVFLAPRATTGSSDTHFTAIHVEDQGWWFLSRPQPGDDQVALVNVAHTNVNQAGNVNNERRYTQQTGNVPWELRGGAPSLTWLGAGGRCVLIGCRFDWSVLTEAKDCKQIVDVGTSFLKAVRLSAYQLGLLRGVGTWDPRLLPDFPSEDVMRRPDINLAARETLDPGEHFRPAHLVASVPRPPSYKWESLPPDAALDFDIPHLVPRLAR